MAFDQTGKSGSWAVSYSARLRTPTFLFPCVVVTWPLPEYTKKSPQGSDSIFCLILQFIAQEEKDHGLPGFI